MAADATTASTPTPPDLSSARRYVILGMVVLSVTLYSTSILIVAAVLPQLQGAMQATPDEISWTMTFNILATAMFTPLTGWLSARFGRRNLLAGSVALFAIATYFCGAANSLEALIFWRVVQGAAGAPLPPDPRLHKPAPTAQWHGMGAAAPPEPQPPAAGACAGRRLHKKSGEVTGKIGAVW